MGACVSSDGARNTNDGMDFQDAGQVEKSRAIDKDLRAYEKTLSKEVKILLLGAGESGKTTVLKVLPRLPSSARKTLTCLSKCA